MIYLSFVHHISCPRTNQTHIFSLFVHLAMLYAELGTIELGDKKESHKEPIFLADNQKKTKG